MINLSKSTIEDLSFLFSRCEVERIAVVWWAAKKKVVALLGRKKKNNAIFSKYSSPDKSCQGQTYGRLLDRKHYVCAGLFAWRALLKEHKLLGDGSRGG